MVTDIEFQSCPRVSVGAEVELQVLDPQSDELAPGGLRILKACQDEGIAGVSGEFLLCMLEVKSDPCENVAELRANLVPRLRQVRNIAQSLGYDLGLGGTHPCARPSMSAVFPDPRYQKIIERQGWMGYQEDVFGMHVHVGVPSGDAAIGAMNLCVEYLPHLLALSANSPFWHGVDSEFASARARMFRPSAGVGVPPRFSSWQHFCHYADTLRGAGLIETTKDMYWDIRPQPKYGTLEFRVFDVPSTLSSLFGLVALTRCLVAQQLQRLNEDPQLLAGDEQVSWLAAENKWLAARYGVALPCMRRPGGTRQTIAADVSELIASLTGIAGELGELEYLGAIDPARGLEVGTDRQRRIFRQSGTWHAVVDDLRSRWLSELDQHDAYEANPERPIVPPAQPNGTAELPAEPLNGAIATDYI